MSPVNQVLVAHKYLTGKSWTERSITSERVKINIVKLLRIDKKPKQEISHGYNKKLC